MESVTKQVIVQVEKVGLKFYDQEGYQLEIFTDVELIKPTDAKFSPGDGKYLAVLTSGGITILNMDNGEVSGELKLEDISVIDFSPNGTYIIACSKYTEGQSNLLIINMQGDVVAKHVWKSGSKEGCQNMSWTNDEFYMARRDAKSSKSLHVYEVNESLQNEFGVINQDKITSFAFSPHGGDEAKPYFLLVGSSGERSSLTRFYQMKTCDKEKFKNLSKGGQEMNYMFAPNGHAVIIWTQHIVDQTGQSYYGNHDLRYVQLGGGNKRSKVAVFDNQVHDVSWSPDSEDFIVISGIQPAVCTLYTKNCIPTFEFGKIHANTIRYNPFSNLLLLGGFGNLVGDIQFWNKDTLKLIGKNKAHCTVGCEWSPDGSQVMTAVLYPRVRVDNEVKQFSYNGKRLDHRVIGTENELYASLWRPQPIISFSKIEVSEDCKVYLADKDPDEIQNKPKPASNKPKGTFTLPKSTAFSAMMRTEMNAATLQGPRKLKKDDYKEYLIETAEEKKALTAKPAPKKSAPKNSWRTKEGFKIPGKESKPAPVVETKEEEMKLTPAPQEYKAPVQLQPGQTQNNQNQKKKKNKNKNKKNKPNQSYNGKGGGGGNGYNGQPTYAEQQLYGTHVNNNYNQYDDYYDSVPQEWYGEYY